jgi:hypothetical protein
MTIPKKQSSRKPRHSVTLDYRGFYYEAARSWLILFLSFGVLAYQHITMCRVMTLASSTNGHSTIRRLSCPSCRSQSWIQRFDYWKVGRSSATTRIISRD